MKTCVAIIALALATSLMGQRPLPRTDDQNQRVKRGVFLRAGILGAAGLVATQAAGANVRGAGWAMFAGSGASIFAIQIVIGDRVRDEPRRRIPFVKYPY